MKAGAGDGQECPSYGATSISVIVICKNEAATIRGCLDSVSWADEIVVLDSGSTDGTLDVCREYTDRVHSTDWPGYGPQKNRALGLTTGEWVLSIDADEYVSPELFAAIRTAVESPGENVAFRCPRLSSYCGRWIRHSGWWPDHVTRLFRREAARFSDDAVHERLVVDGPVGTLTEPLRHESFRSVESVLHKLDEYSTASARMMFARGKRGSLTKAILRGAWTFLRTYVLRLGFLDGRAGLMLAISNAEGTYYRYVKLMMMGEAECGMRSAECGVSALTGSSALQAEHPLPLGEGQGEGERRATTPYDSSPPHPNPLPPGERGQPSLTVGASPKTPHSALHTPHSPSTPHSALRTPHSPEVAP